MNGNKMKNGLSQQIFQQPARELQLKYHLAITYFFKALFEFGRKRGCSFVIIIDDIQWINSASREALTFFLDQISAESLKGIFLVSRDDYDLQKMLPKVRHSSIILLGPLTESSCSELIDKSVGQNIIPSQLIDAILSLSQGNPYFLEEIILSLYERSIIDFESGQWKWVGQTGHLPIPTTLESLLLSRVDCLPKNIKVTIHVASVLGRKLDRKILLAILERLGFDHEDTESNLSLLYRLDFLNEDSSEPDVLFFSQNLFQHVVYQSILKGNREILHEMAAENYKKMAKGDNKYFSFVAHHYLHSSRPMLALSSLVSTVKQFVAEFRSEEAQPFVDRGLELLATKEEKEGLYAEDKFFIWVLLVEKAKIAEILNDHQGRKDILDKLMQMAVSDGDPQKIAEIKNRIAYYAIHMGKYEQAITASQEILKMPEIEGTIYYANAIRYLGLSCFNLGNYQEAEKHLRHSLEIRSVLHDSQGEARDLSSLSMVLWRHGEYENAIKILKRSLEIRQKRGDLRGSAHDHNNMGLNCWAMGDLQNAKKNYMRALEIYGQIGDRRNEGNALSNLSLLLLNENDLDSAIDYARRSLDWSNRYKLFRLNINSRIYLAKIMIEAEENPDLDKILPLLESAIQDAQNTEYFQAVLDGAYNKAELFRKAGRLPEAYEISCQAMQLMKQLVTGDEEIFWVHYQVAMEHGKKEEALETLAKALEFIKERGKKIVNKEAQKMYILNNRTRMRIVEWHKKWFS